MLGEYSISTLSAERGNAEGSRVWPNCLPRWLDILRIAAVERDTISPPRFLQERSPHRETPDSGRVLNRGAVGVLSRRALFRLSVA